MSILESSSPRRAAAALLALAACAPLAAQTLHTLQSAPLRAERSPDAAALVSLAPGESVNLLQMRGGWAQVQAGSAKGWVRASQLDVEGAAVASVSQIETGRRATGATAVTLGVRALPPRSTRHALIVGIGAYAADPARPVPPLAGIEHDMASALAMAQLLQVPADNITLLRDGAATSDGVRQALRDLEGRVLPGDRVFIYWSGHGSRYFDAAEGGCVETLVPHDLHDIGNRQFAQWIQPLATKADKMLVVYDACHSGGMSGTGGAAAAASRSLAPGFVPKFIGGTDACQQATNLRSRGLGSAAGALGMSGQDLVHLSSSRPDEVSFDNAATGGLATSALRQCLQGDARDLDGSGAISIDELVACAQNKIEARLKGVPQLEPQHLIVTGNRGFVPAWFAGNPAPQVTAPAVSVPAPAVAMPVVVATPPLPARPPAAVPVQSVLEQIHAQRDSKRRVTVTLAADTLRIGADALDFSVTSSHAGDVYIAMLGSDRQSLTLLFPNELDGRNHIAAGESLLLPRASWRIVAGGPKGDDTLLVMVTDGPRDLTTLAGGKAGPFARPLTDATGRARLQWLLGTRAAGGVGCFGGACSDAFGSALVTLHEQ